MEYDDFINFLMAERVWEEFNANINDMNIGGAGSITARYIYKKDGPENILKGAFNWKLSPEGVDHWNDISNKWRVHLNGIR